ncbi:MAG: DUF1611 domain-containing protein [Deltaproteobacteria bacterium]|uniref:DUF1611 domain-containing protein n=1 Tax=Candidatus Zymogenus saltonus TaxID=2844893 RepID=A0A9D8KDH0_9DELT|nr:DUF1611 domain-containing protein [Candidatus Zymogenus saltonus]
MNHFEPKRAVLVYRPGSDKALYNLLKYSRVVIETVLLAEFDLPMEERKRFTDLNPNLVFTDNVDEALDTDSDTFLWTREVFEAKDDYRLWRDILLAAVKKGKNIYNMAKLPTIDTEPELHKAISEKGVKYWSASDHARAMGEVDIFGPYPDLKIKAKVVTLLGTGRRCGKFTTTKLVRARLNNAGIKAAELATEPYGLLTGADYMMVPHVMPMWRSAPAIKNALIHLDKTLKPDVILVSSQSGFRADPLTAPGRCGGVVAVTIAEASAPDAAILSAPIEYFPSVTDEIRCIEFLLDCPVIGVSVKGGEYTDEEIDGVLRELHAATDLPAFDPVRSPEGVEGLIRAIVKMVG